MTFSTNPFQIISDGNNMYLIRGDKAYKLSNPFLHRMDFSYLCNNISMDIFGGHHHIIKGQDRIEFSIEGEASEMEDMESADILIDFFQSATIRDLLKEIDNKIDKRKL